MQKLMIGIALLFITGASALAQQESQETSTRFGALTVGEDKILMFNGHKLLPVIEGNNSPISANRSASAPRTSPSLLIMVVQPVPLCIISLPSAALAQKQVRCLDRAATLRK